MLLACQHHSHSRHHCAIITIITIPIIITIIITDAICLSYAVLPISILAVTIIIKTSASIVSAIVILPA